MNEEAAHAASHECLLPGKHPLLAEKYELLVPSHDLATFLYRSLKHRCLLPGAQQRMGYPRNIQQVEGALPPRRNGGSGRLPKEMQTYTLTLIVSLLRYGTSTALPSTLRFSISYSASATRSSG